jgi:hypothetical protein
MGHMFKNTSIDILCLEIGLIAKHKDRSQASWWCTSAITAHVGQKQEDHEF